MEELEKLIIDTIGKKYWERVEFSDYELKEVEELDKIQEGWYFVKGGTIIGVYEKGNTDGEPLFYLRQNYTISFYRDYKYFYDRPYVTSKKPIEIWD